MRREMLSAAAGVAAGVLLLGACSSGSQPASTGGSSGPTASAAPQTSPASAPPASSGSAASAVPSSAVSSTAASGPIPPYPGATVISHIGGFTLLRSDDSVSKVGAYYVDTLARDGWQTVSRYQGRYSVNVVAKRGGERVTVQVSPTGSGSSISVTLY